MNKIKEFVSKNKLGITIISGCLGLGYLSYLWLTSRRSKYDGFNYTPKMNLKHYFNKLEAKIFVAI